jgi:xanthine/CO dehydrogenase XdhC/CoxF family maturation factor
LESLLERSPRNADGVLATVVATAGSTYRKPGARMLIMADGSAVGLLSGGCLEADLALHARAVFADGQPRAVEYDMRGPDDVLFGIGAGCEGAMRVLLEPAGPGTRAQAALAAAAQTTRTGRPAALVAVHDSAELVLGTYEPAALPPPLAGAASRALAEAASQQLDFEGAARRGRAYVQFLAPPPHLLVCGAGPDAEPVVGAALGLGWRVSVVDHRPAYADARRFPGAQVHRSDARELRAALAVHSCHAAVVMSHHLQSDMAYLSELADAGAPDYVGLLGPAARRLRLAHEMGGKMQALGARLSGPVGIDIGAVTPEGIALSIVSEIHAWLAGR